MMAFSVNAKIMAFDCLIYGLISYQIVQCRYLKDSFKNITGLAQRELITGKPTGQYLREHKHMKNIQKIQLNEWVEKHCRLIEISTTLNQLYSPVFFVQFIFSILIICSNAFVVTAGNVTKLELVFSFAYVIGTTVQLYTLCWMGEELSKQSTTLTDDGFWHKWYLCPLEVQSSFQIIFERTKVPMKISIFGTIHLSIETFKTIVGTAYSYFMVLNRIKRTV
ncbi:hypothetical protein J6590_108650 [Homalodisca vitripennis]|nr:hypothetical protein J6590_108650 [Homalodisca vitripennis]